MSAHDAIGQQFEVSPLKRSELGDAPGAATSRKVSASEYQTLAGQGRQHLESLAGKSSRRGLDKHWGDITSSAHQAAAEPWGGATYKASTGRAVSPGANAYAVRANEPGQAQVSVKPDARPEEFEAAMSKVRESMPEHATHIGVFHDADKGRVDINPVNVVNSRQKVEQVGAYTRAAGGAYHFRSGNGYYPPHVED